MFKDLTSAIKENIRDYGMYMALAVIMIIFTTLTNGLFLTPRVVSDLIDMTGYIAVLSVGMTLVIVIRHIDLSVGYIAGFLGAIAAILSSKVGLPLYLIFPLVLLLGAVVGVLWTGTLVAKLKIPAFVATLAAMTIFRGLLIRTTNSATIFTDSDAFNAVGNGYIPDFFQNENIHMLTLLIGVVAIILYIIMEIRNRNKQIEYKLHVSTFPIFLGKLLFVAVIVMYFVWKIANLKNK